MHENKLKTEKKKPIFLRRRCLVYPLYLRVYNELSTNLDYYSREPKPMLDDPRFTIGLHLII